MTPDGGRILTGAGSSRVMAPGEVAGNDRLTDETATLWDAQNGAPVLSLWNSKGPLQEVAISADGRRALTGSGRMAAILWDLEY
jgi:WD40 repeat protein